MKFFKMCIFFNYRKWKCDIPNNIECDFFRQLKNKNYCCCINSKEEFNNMKRALQGEYMEDAL